MKKYIHLILHQEDQTSFSKFIFFFKLFYWLTLKIKPFILSQVYWNINIYVYNASLCINWHAFNWWKWMIKLKKRLITMCKSKVTYILLATHSKLINFFLLNRRVHGISIHSKLKQKFKTICTWTDSEIHI